MSSRRNWFDNRVYEASIVSDNNNNNRTGTGRTGRTGNKNNIRRDNNNGSLVRGVGSRQHYNHHHHQQHVRRHNNNVVVELEDEETQPQLYSVQISGTTGGGGGGNGGGSNGSHPPTTRNNQHHIREAISVCEDSDDKQLYHHHHHHHDQHDQQRQQYPNGGLYQEERALPLQHHPHQHQHQHHPHQHHHHQKETARSRRNGTGTTLHHFSSCTSSSSSSTSNKFFYGRQKELSTLHHLYIGCSSTSYSGYESNPIVFLSGNSGCGKTALINEFIYNRLGSGSGSGGGGSNSKPHIFLKGKYTAAYGGGGAAAGGVVGRGGDNPFRPILDAISTWCKSLLTNEQRKVRMVLSKTIGNEIKKAIGDRDDLDTLQEMIPGLSNLLLLDNDNEKEEEEGIENQGTKKKGSLLSGCGLLTTTDNDVSVISRCSTSNTTGSCVNNVVGRRKMVQRMSTAKLKYMFSALIKAMANNPSRPLIMFLDDLQWADTSSLDLLKSIWLDDSRTNNDLKNLLFIGSYRSEEVIQHKDHPLLLLIDDLNQSRGGGNNIINIELRELSMKHLTEFVQQNCSLNLNLQHNEARELTSAVYSTTNGNIYHTIQAIDELVRKQVYYFDEYAQKWRWNLPQQQQQQQRDRDRDGCCGDGDGDGSSSLLLQVEVEQVLSDSIIDTINSKLVNYMPELLQQSLLIASYIKNEFDVDTLLQSMHSIGLIYITRMELIEVLDCAVFEGLLLSTTSSYGDDGGDGTTISYAFAHDSIQETSRTLTQGEEMNQMFIRLGMALCDRGMDPEVGEDWMLFVAAQHWNTAKANTMWPELDEDKLKLANLNLKIAEISLGVAAFDEAIAFLMAGIDALEDSLDPEEKWVQFYEYTKQLHHLLMDVLYTVGKFDVLEPCIVEVLENAQSLKDKGPAFVHSLGIIMQAKDRDHAKAIRKGIEFLSLLGVTIDVDPDDVQAEEISKAEQDCQQALAGQKVLDLLDYPVTDDDTVLCLLEQMSRASVYSGKVPFVYVLGQLAIQICAQEQCISEFLPRIYMYSAFYYRKLDLTMMAYDCAATCKEIIDRVEDASTEGYCKVTVTCNNGLQLCRPTRLAVGVYQECYVKSIRAGDTEFSSLVANSYCQAFFLSGIAITSKAERKFALFESESRRYNQPPSVYSMFQVYRQLVANLQGKSKEDPAQLDGDFMTEKDILSRFGPDTPQYKQTLRDMSSCKLMAAVVFDDLPTMKQMIQNLKSWPDYDILLHRLNMRLFWVALASFALARDSFVNTKKERAEYTEMSKKYLKFYEDMSNGGSNPNAKVIHVCLLAESDQKKVNYNTAIKACQEHNFIHLEALMNERCGMYQRKRKKRVKAEPYFLRAYELYHQYGATGKVRCMQEENGYEEKDLGAPSVEN